MKKKRTLKLWSTMQLSAWLFNVSTAWCNSPNKAKNRPVIGNSVVLFDNFS